MPVPPYLHLLNACPATPTSTQRLSTSTQRLSRHTYIHSTLVAAISKKEGGNIFQFMKLEELMAGEDSELAAGKCSRLAGIHLRSEK
jgi:hypothetical protein